MADVIGLPNQLISGQAAQWNTSLDLYSSDSYDLLWFFRPTGETTWTDVVIGIGDGSNWCTTFEPGDNALDLEYQVKVRADDTHIVTDIASGLVSVLVVISTLEAQVNAIREALITIGQGGKPQSYSIRGRSLSQYSLGELTELYNMLKRELQTEQRKKRSTHGLILGNFGFHR